MSECMLNSLTCSTQVSMMDAKDGEESSWQRPDLRFSVDEAICRSLLVLKAFEAEFTEIMLNLRSLKLNVISSIPPIIF